MAGGWGEVGEARPFRRAKEETKPPESAARKRRLVDMADPPQRFAAGGCPGWAWPPFYARALVALRGVRLSRMYGYECFVVKAVSLPVFVSTIRSGSVRYV